MSPHHPIHLLGLLLVSARALLSTHKGSLKPLILGRFLALRRSVYSLPPLWHEPAVSSVPNKAKDAQEADGEEATEQDARVQRTLRLDDLDGAVEEGSLVLLFVRIDVVHGQGEHILPGLQGRVGEEAVQEGSFFSLLHLSVCRDLAEVLDVHAVVVGRDYVPLEGGDVERLVPEVRKPAKSIDKLSLHKLCTREERCENQPQR